MKLHLGSGNINKEGWLNIDLDSPNADLHLDLRKPLKFDDESVDYIFNEHFIEHITREEAVALLKECYRVLNNNGVLRLSTPNLKYIAVSYLARNLDEWGELWRPTRPCILLNEAMSSWGHKFLYDAEELTLILYEAGFPDVRFVKWRESAIDQLVGLETRPFHNELIVEVFKTRQIDASQEANAELNESELWLDDVHKMMLNQLKHLEQIISAQAVSINQIDADWQARGQHIERLERAIELSWSGKLRSTVRKLSNYSHQSYKWLFNLSRLER